METTWNDKRRERAGDPASLARTMDRAVVGSAHYRSGDARRRATPRAVLHAWMLARAHGHHWASSASPEALEYGRALRALRSPAPSGDERAQLEARLAEAQASYDAWMARPCTEGSVPPRTAEEAEALSALPSGPIGGVEFSLNHVTGTGRLGWSVDPLTGAVDVTVYRPGERPCLHLKISGDLRRVAVDVGPAPCRVRHVEAANGALAALGLPTLAPGDAILADDAGRTPAWWEAVESLVDEVAS